MEIAKGTPTKDITVQGFQLAAPTPFSEGHPLTETEAAVLNQTLAENLRNNFGAQIKKSKEEAEAAGEKYEPNEKELQKAFNDYVAEYEFGAKRGGSGGVTMDPVERRARRLANEAIKRAVQAKGLLIKDVGTERIKELSDNYFEKNSDVLLKQARDLLDMEKRTAEATAVTEIEV